MSMARHGAIHAAPRSATATVVLIAGPALPGIGADVARWRRLTPSARWASAGLTKADRTTIIHRLQRLAGQRGVRPGQLILLGAGETGRRTLEAVLQGALDCAGMLAVDIPCDPLSFRVGPVAAAIRLVVHHDDLQPPEESLIRQVQHSDIDFRIIGLGSGARSGSRAVARAAETFVLELVAMAGQNGNGV
jgi:hypothetical protein